MLYIDYYQSPIGLLKIKADNDVIYSVEESSKDELENSNALTDKLKQQLDQYFNGKRKQFDVDIKLIGSEFQKKVWIALMGIPYGETASYKEIAAKVGNSKAAIAVGGANNKNKLLILVPCHRVLGSDKKLVGFRLGLEAKQYLLDLERK